MALEPNRPVQYAARGGNRLLLCNFACTISVSVRSPTCSPVGWRHPGLGTPHGASCSVSGCNHGSGAGRPDGLLVRSLGELQLLRLAVTALVIGLCMGRLRRHTMPYMVGSIFVAMTGATLCMPLLNAVLSHRSPVAVRGRMLGVSGAAASWGRVAGPMIAGFNLALFGYHGAWLGCAGLALFIWPGVITVRPPPRGKQQDEAPGLKPGCVAISTWDASSYTTGECIVVDGGMTIQHPDCQRRARGATVAKNPGLTLWNEHRYTLNCLPIATTWAASRRQSCCSTAMRPCRGLSWYLIPGSTISWICRNTIATWYWRTAQPYRPLSNRYWALPRSTLPGSVTWYRSCTCMSSAAARATPAGRNRSGVICQRVKCNSCNCSWQADLSKMIDLVPVELAV